MSRNDEENESVFKSDLYFDLSDAAIDVGTAHGVADKSIAGVKLAGKTLSNTVVLAGKIGLEIFKRVPDALVKQAEKEECEAKNLLKESKNLSPIEQQKFEQGLADATAFKLKQQELRDKIKNKA